MAVPRVFVSSTYYDLKEVRNNIGTFIRNMGYEPVMHEHANVAYVQDKPLEEDCYNELAMCDIVVCVIGSKFGSQSTANDLSITMNEIQKAIKHKKKVYIFINRDMFIENRTYEQNKEHANFKSAYTEDLRIHDFILNLRNNTKVHVIEQFDTTDDIVSMLKNQFAGLFQNLLSREATVTETKTIADLNQTITDIRTAVDTLQKENESFFCRLGSTVLRRNPTLYRIGQHLGLHKSALFASDIEALDEIMDAMGFQSVDVDDILFDIRKYSKENYTTRYTLTLKDSLFNDDGGFKDISLSKCLDNNIIWTETDISNELPF